MTTTTDPPQFLVVTLDRLPAWILPAYGSTWLATPAIDALAGRGVTFDRVIATGDDDLATLRGLGLGAVATEAAVVTDAAHVAAAVKAADVRLLEATCPRAPAADATGTNLARLCVAAGDLIAADRHPVVWLHAASLGVAWDAPLECREAYFDPADPRPYADAAVPEMELGADADPDLLVGIRQAFAGQLTHLDACLAPLLEAAGGRHVLVAGVRGLGLGLHGRVGTGPLAPYGELVHVPAIFADARGRMAAQRYGGLVVPADLGALLGDLGLAVAPGGAAAAGGHSLAGLLTDWSAPERDRVIATTAHGVAIVTPGWHLVAATGRPPRLFHKPDDYFELCDVADRCPAVVEELAPLAAAAAGGDPQRAWTAPLSAATRLGQ
jgi:hypothetical protein